MHNTNRCNSYNDIDVLFFRDTYPYQQVKMTVSKETLLNLSDGVIYLHELGFQFTCNLAYGIDWGKQENTTILEEQLNKLINFYLMHPELEPCLILDPKRLINIAAPQEKFIKTCGAGWTMKAYDYDGKCYPCQHFLPLSVGEERAAAALKIEFGKEDIPKNLAALSYCKNCVIHNSCQTCYGANYEATGDILTPDKNMCALFKIQFKALAFFVSKLFEQGLLEKYYPSDYLNMLKSALIINDYL
jgi:radical SAM protein with 4Fe4S-binding SPASM domain